MMLKFEPSITKKNPTDEKRPTDKNQWTAFHPWEKFFITGNLQ